MTTWENEYFTFNFVANGTVVVVSIELSKEIPESQIIPAIRRFKYAYKDVVRVRRFDSLIELEIHSSCFKKDTAFRLYNELLAEVIKTELLNYFRQ